MSNDLDMQLLDESFLLYFGFSFAEDTKTVVLFNWPSGHPIVYYTVK